MLIKGASRDIKDISGKRPVDMIESGGLTANQKAELEGILGKQPLNLPCSQIKTPLKKLTKNYRTFVIYVLLMLITFIQLHLFVLPFGPFFKNRFYVDCQFIVLNFFFLRAAFKNPGYVQKIKNLNFDKLVEKYDAQGLCPNCETIYEKDSRHCYICD